MARSLKRWIPLPLISPDGYPVQEGGLQQPHIVRVEAVEHVGGVGPAEKHHVLSFGRVSTIYSALGEGQPELPVVGLHRQGHIGLEVLQEGVEVVVEGAVVHVEDKCHGNVVEHVLLVVLAVVRQVQQQVLLIRQLVMELEMVQSLPEHLALQGILVPETLVGLLPAEIYEHILGVVELHPVVPVQHDPPDELRIIPQPHTVLT